MGFDQIVADVNKACLDAFGQSFIHTSMTTGQFQTVCGILEAGVEPEDRAPGDGSVYAGFWFQNTDIDPVPETGDEIESETAVYKIVRMEMDAGNGLRMLLRQDRLIE